MYVAVVEWRIARARIRSECRIFGQMVVMVVAAQVWGSCGVGVGVRCCMLCTNKGRCSKDRL
jgi:hypothetical protein